MPSDNCLHDVQNNETPSNNGGSPSKTSSSLDVTEERGGETDSIEGIRIEKDMVRVEHNSCQIQQNGNSEDKSPSDGTAMETDSDGAQSNVSKEQPIGLENGDFSDCFVDKDSEMDVERTDESMSGDVVGDDTNKNDSCDNGISDMTNNDDNEQTQEQTPDKENHIDGETTELVKSSELEETENNANSCSGVDISTSEGTNGEEKSGTLTEDESKGSTAGDPVESDMVDCNESTVGKELTVSGTAVPDEKTKDNDSDSDDDRPQIFLRDFSEITERDSDDEDVQELFIPEQSVVSNTFVDSEPITSSLQIKTYSKKDKIVSKLAEIATFDDNLADVEMTFESGQTNDEMEVRKQKTSDRTLSRACTKLTSWLRRQSSAGNTENLRNPSIAPPPVRTSFQDTNRQSRMIARDSSAAVINSMLQSVQQTYQPVTLSGTLPQISYGRGTTAPSRSRQPVPPLSLISSTFAPGTAIIAQPVSLWPSTGPQGVQKQTTADMHSRNNTTVTSVMSGPRPATVGGNTGSNNVLNVQSPFTQLIYDPATGYLLCPANQNCQVPQPPTPVQPPRIGPPSAALRIQNGMILRPSDVGYNGARPVLGTRNGLEISLNTVPQTSSQQRMPQPLLLPSSSSVLPLRPLTPVQQPRQPVNSRLARPPFISQNQNMIQPNMLTSQQAQQTRARALVPQKGPPVRFNPVRPVAPQVQRPPVRNVPPHSQRPPVPVRPTVPQRANGLPVPVVLPIKAAGTPLPSGSVEMGNITAGNQKPIPGTVEESDSELQNKTFPSLVVQVKTCLTPKPTRQLLTKSRSDLDASVKAVLIYTPSKFTEWLMRRGALKLAHYCDLHSNQAFKLGMYSDCSRQPFSGGYVWTSECCPDRQISVFNGSIFEGSKYPPGTVLKLMYHWACQTPANNILQWVKISSLYLKNFFTLLRAVCISWMHEQCPPMGGESKYVEIGVITLGSSAETSRGVKNVNVEILGVFDPATKIIRMKVINSMQGQLFKDKNKSGKPDAYEQGARAFQILWPLTHWVDKRSILLVDGIIDRALFQELGFKNIQQCGDNRQSMPTNINVMNYLRNLVPKMFSSTLSVLSKSIVQQFLDELSWREMYGQSVLTCYDNLLDHISSMTKWDLRGESLITRLNKINQNPFVDWSYTKQTRRCPLNTVPLSLRNEPGIRECIKHVMKDEKKQPPPPPVYTPSPPPTFTPTAATYAAPQQKPAQKRKTADYRDVVANISYYREFYEKSPKVHSLQSYYYGSLRADENTPAVLVRFPQNLKCPMCTRTFSSNIEICRHIYTHISSVTYRGSENSVCRICLKELPAGVTMQQHMHVAHIMVAFNTACRICEEKFKTEQELVIHMWDLHQRRETPYRCGICNYASSFHYYAIQHHQEKHANEAEAICPFCLKVFNCATVGQLKQLINHLQVHAQLQRRAKKCPRCVLTFVTEADQDIHMTEHRSQEPSAKWIPYLLPPNEANIKMATPPPSKTPLNLLAMAGSALSGGAAPPAKRQKLSQQTTKKNKLTLNATMAVPIDTNEKFGGSKYRIVIPSSATGVCGECGDDINKQNHFIGKLICTKCRYSTACQAAMNLHHVRNHKTDSQSNKPGIKTNKVKELDEAMACKCGFSSTHPNKIAKHLINCEKFTVYPIRIPSQDSAVTMASDSSEALLPVPDPDPPSIPDRPTTPNVSLSPTLGLLGCEAVTTFEDMLNLEESMASTLDSLALPPLLSPSASIPQSPLSVFATPASTSNTNPQVPVNSSSNDMGSTESSNSTWDPDAWELPLSGLIAKCKSLYIFDFPSNFLLT